MYSPKLNCTKLEKKNNKINVSQQIAVDKETLQKKVEFDRPGERSPE